MTNQWHDKHSVVLVSLRMISIWGTVVAIDVKTVVLVVVAGCVLVLVVVVGATVVVVVVGATVVLVVVVGRVVVCEQGMH